MRQEYTGKFTQARRLLPLGLAAMWLAGAGACVSVGSATPTERPTTERSPPLTPESPGASYDGSVLEEAHRYYDEARRMALRTKCAEGVRNN